ncbi:MAG: FRG domain-containing protein [Legionellales bacterium]|nr:FRG domain-containing protein [Legionellales bacterium]
MKKSKNWLWEHEKFTNGYNCVELKSWGILHDFLIRHDYTYPNFIFRGHSRESFTLVSPLQRDLAELVRLDKYHYLENFKLAIRGRMKADINRYFSEKELWVIGHNHGLKTPLLAWTQAPFIATFFAFYNERKLTLSAEAKPRDLKLAKDLIQEHRTIYILNRRHIDELRKEYRLDILAELYPKAIDYLKQIAGNVVSFNDRVFLDQYIDQILNSGNKSNFPADFVSACRTATYNRDREMIDIFEPTMLDNPRLISQACLFTLHPMDTTLESWVQDYFEDCEDEVLIKVNMPNNQRELCLQTLHQMNINNLSLFPDLDGAARYCNDLLKGLY